MVNNNSDLGLKYLVYFFSKSLILFSNCITYICISEHEQHEMTQLQNDDLKWIMER